LSHPSPYAGRLFDQVRLDTLVGQVDGCLYAGYAPSNDKNRFRHCITHLQLLAVR
jgi:hypothetical protein